jgi:hypothetical protein
MTRMRKTPGKGKLLRERWHRMESTSKPELCYSCQYFDQSSTTVATQYRQRKFEKAVHNVYFCDKHAQIARDID